MKMSVPNNDTDKEFSALEKLAFRGRWSEEEKSRLMQLYRMDKLVGGAGSSPEHDRLQHLGVIYSIIADYGEMDFVQSSARDVLESYILAHKSSRRNLPSEEHCPKEAMLTNLILNYSH